MSSIPDQIPLPTSYKDLPFSEIVLSHIPENSPSPTPIILLTLHRPGKHNAFTNTMMTELIQAFTLIDVDPRVKCAIVTGHGRIFCAGADLESAFKGGEEPIREHRDGGGRVALAVQKCRKPIIGALQGSAVGIGITMTLPMSIRIAYEGAKIGFVFARRGLVMEACSSYYLPRLIGMSKALHLTTTGSTYPASHPLLNSLFSETLSSPDKVLPRAIEVATEIVQNTSPISTYLMREMMYRDAGSPEGQHLLDSRVIYEMFSSKDNKEGVKAFLEKRAVKFEGTMQDDAPGAYPWWEPVDTTNRPVPEGYAYKPKSRL